VNLIDRYLRAVRDNLPRAQQDDIINELSENLRSRFEDEETTRGRPLLEAEEVAILKNFGHPMAVAARYRGDERSVTFGRRLIGPELFPTYMKVLGVNVAITLLIGLIALVASFQLWPGFFGVVVPLAIQFVIVTGVFVVIDAHWVRNPDGWDPRTVNAMGPDVDVSSLDGLAVQLIGKEHSRAVAVAVTTSILEIGLLAIALTAWLAIGMPATIGFLEPGPGWRDLFVPITAVIVATLLTPVVTLVRPTWTRFRVAAHVVIDVATIAIGVVSLALGSWVLLADPATATASDASLAELINSIVRFSIAGTIVLTAINAALETRRLIRMGRTAAVTGSMVAG
jgi:hypothetical protein